MGFGLHSDHQFST